MGIPMFILSGLLESLAALQRKASTQAIAAQVPCPPRALRVVRPTVFRPPVRPRPVSAICAPRLATLRVVRVCDVAPAPGEVGRMRISGRMADVCAELERLAAREAAAALH